MFQNKILILVSRIALINPGVMWWGGTQLKVEGELVTVVRYSMVDLSHRLMKLCYNEGGVTAVQGRDAPPPPNSPLQHLLVASNR